MCFEEKCSIDTNIQFIIKLEIEKNHNYFGDIYDTSSYGATSLFNGHM